MEDPESKLVVLPSSVSSRLGLYAASEFKTREFILEYPGKPTANTTFNEIVEKCAQWKVKKKKNAERVTKLKALGLRIEKVKMRELKNGSFEYSYQKIDLDWSEIQIKWAAIAETISSYSFGIGDIEHLVINQNTFTLMIERVTVDGDIIPRSTDHGYFMNEPLDPLIASEFENLLLQCNQFSLNNVDAIPNIDKKSVTLIARKNIKAGEEILMYYGDLYNRIGRVPMSNTKRSQKKKWFALKFEDSIKFTYSKETSLSMPEKIIMKSPFPFMGTSDSVRNEENPTIELANMRSFKRKYTGSSERPPKKRKINEVEELLNSRVLPKNDPPSNDNRWENSFPLEKAQKTNPVIKNELPSNSSYWARSFTLEYPKVKNPVFENKYKTTMCKGWLNHSCSYGGACKFSHGKSEMRCFNFHVTRYCSHGDQCTLIH